ncbi:MAG: hypothetical protein RL757_325 [Bacteroidota bacterium]
MKKYFSIFLFLGFSVVGAMAQKANGEETTTDSLPEVVISANRIETAAKNISQQVSVLSSREIGLQNSQNMGDLLANSGAAFVQKSQQGGGSPVLRGFEASRVLLMLDGIRMNNLLYRAGHLQNPVMFDQAAMERVEVAYGPSSVAYGSDALGGSIQFITKKATFSDNTGGAFSGKVWSRMATNNEWTNSATLNFGWKNFASLTAVTYSDFGDLTMGKNASSLGEFGLRTFTSERINGKDSMVATTNKYLQSPASYNQINIMQKFAFKQLTSAGNFEANANFYYTNSTNIPRYDRLTEIRNGLPRSAEWYYGPQQQVIGALNLQLRDVKGFFNAYRLQTSYQDYKESRNDRNFRSNFTNHRKENVKMTQVNFEAEHRTDNFSLLAGLEYITESLVSTANKTSILIDSTAPQNTRYPDGKNTRLTTALFITSNYKINEEFQLNAGLRATNINLNSTFVDRTFFPFPFSEVTQKNEAICGNLGLIYHFMLEHSLVFNLSNGFRAPNVDDLSKVFESAGKVLFVPNPNIKPEQTMNYEFAYRFNTDDRKISVEAGAFYTNFTNAITAAKFTFNGADSVLYNGAKAAVFANQNAGKAFVRGGSFGAKVAIGDMFSVRGNANFTEGRLTINDNATPLDHVPPVFGRIGVDFRKGSFTTQLFVVFNGEKPIENYRLGAEDNEVYARPTGTPAWKTFNWNAEYRLPKYATIQAGVDNIADAQYRTFSSGINGAGRNFYLKLTANW